MYISTLTPYNIQIVQYKFCSPGAIKRSTTNPPTPILNRPRKTKKKNQVEEDTKQIRKMIPTRTLLQAAAAEHHTPLIRFLGKRSPTSMFNFNPPFPPPPLHLLSLTHTHI